MSDEPQPAALPADNHVHTEWSWDAELGAMEASCVRAMELGLPAIAFTEHWDPTPTPIDPDALPHLPPLIRKFVSDGVFQAPPLDVEGYAERLAVCRAQFPDLRIWSGVELGEPHWWPDELASLLGRLPFERVLGSVHCLEVDGQYRYVEGLYGGMKPGEVIRGYLAEVARLAESDAPFAVLAHIDYPVRGWPAASAGPFSPAAFEEEYRVALRALALSGRALEVNTTVPLHAEVVRWWREEGGRAVSFGSDAHEPGEIARGFAAAREMAEAFGFSDASEGLWFAK